PVVQGPDSTEPNARIPRSPAHALTLASPARTRLGNEGLRMSGQSRIEKQIVASVTTGPEEIRLHFASGLVLPLPADEEDVPGLLQLASISQQYHVPIGLCFSAGEKLLGIGSLLRSVPRAIWSDP